MGESRSFAEMVEEQWALRQGDRRANYRSLYEALKSRGVEISYEATRQMVIGQLKPRPDVMEAVAALLQLPPDAFTDYRLYKVQEIMRTHPTLADEVYELLMDHAAAEDESNQQPAK